MEKRINSSNVVWYWASGSLFFGLILMGIGGYYLAKYMGWIAQDFPFWPSVLIILGFMFVVTSIKRVVRQY